MLTDRLLPQVPRAAALLGLAGVIPFAAGALGTVTRGALGTLAVQALLAYGAVILSFLGGIQWGLATAHGRADLARLGLSVLPSLVGWAALLLGGAWGLLLLAAAFVGVLAVDLGLTREGTAPPWFPRLRVALTGAVLLCLTIAILLRGTIGASAGI